LSRPARRPRFRASTTGESEPARFFVMAGRFSASNRGSKECARERPQTSGSGVLTYLFEYTKVLLRSLGEAAVFLPLSCVRAPCRFRLARSIVQCPVLAIHELLLGIVERKDNLDGARSSSLGGPTSPSGPDRRGRVPAPRRWSRRLPHQGGGWPSDWSRERAGRVRRRPRGGGRPDERARPCSFLATDTFLGKSSGAEGVRLACSNMPRAARGNSPLCLPPVSGARQTCSCGTRRPTTENATTAGDRGRCPREAQPPRLGDFNHSSL